MAETFEPSHPIFLGLFEIHPPGPVLVPVLLNFFELTRHADPSGFQFADSAAVVAPFYGGVL
jgi:hypothetical protein